MVPAVPRNLTPSEVTFAASICGLPLGRESLALLEWLVRDPGCANLDKLLVQECAAIIVGDIVSSSRTGTFNDCPGRHHMKRAECKSSQNYNSIDRPEVVPGHRIAPPFRYGLRVRRRRRLFGLRRLCMAQFNRRNPATRSGMHRID